MISSVDHAVTTEADFSSYEGAPLITNRTVQLAVRAALEHRVAIITPLSCVMVVITAGGVSNETAVAAFIIIDVIPVIAGLRRVRGAVTTSRRPYPTGVTALIVVNRVSILAGL